ncbi:MAG: hypothetical protein ACRDO2_10010 [Nocardioidaceae bacterium]
MDQAQAAVTAAAITAVVSVASTFLSLRSSRKQAASASIEARAQADSASKEARVHAEKTAREQREFYERQTQEVFKFVRELAAGGSSVLGSFGAGAGAAAGVWPLQTLAEYRPWLADLKDWLDRLQLDGPWGGQKFSVRLLQITAGLREYERTAAVLEWAKAGETAERPQWGLVDDLAQRIDSVWYYVERSLEHDQFDIRHNQEYEDLVLEKAYELEWALADAAEETLDGLGFPRPYGPA